MAIWLNNKKQEKRDGCLLILNLNNAAVENLPSDYLEVLQDTHNCAVADGWMVVWAFDNDTTPEQPDRIGKIEEQTHIRMMFDVCGRKDSNFLLDPTERKKEFSQMGEILRNHDAFSWRGPLKIMGSCSIDSSKVLMPPIDVI